MDNKAWKFKELKFPKPDLRVTRLLYADAIERVEMASSGSEVLEVLFEVDEMARKANDLFKATLIHRTMDATDEEAEKDQRWVDENQPFFTKALLEFNDAVYNSPYREFIEEKIGPMYFTSMDVARKAFCDENIALKQREAELADEYHQLIASCRKEVQGEIKTFMELQWLLSHEDREVRKEAFKAFSEFLSSNEEQMERIWNELVKVRTQMGKNLGYENYLPVAYLDRERIDYNKDDVAAFRKQVLDEIVPLCSKLFEEQAKRLGIEQIMVYDEEVLFADGNAKALGDIDYMFKEIVNIFRELSPETEEFINFMLDHDLIDYEIRPEKVARGYTTVLTSKKAPYVFSHFDGLSSSVQYLIEGFGHAFAAYRSSRRQPLEEYFSSTQDIMEIHSMAMVRFADMYSERLFGDDTWKYRLSNLHSLITFIPFGCAVDEFQHICYENPDLTAKDMTAEWHKLEQKYMPWRKYDEDDEFMNRGGYWYHKVHFFAYPLYYIEYALATVNALEVYKKYSDHPGTAWREYLALTDVGGSKSYSEILELANLTPAYKEGSVARAISHVKDVLELA